MQSRRFSGNFCHFSEMQFPFCFWYSLWCLKLLKRKIQLRKGLCGETLKNTYSMRHKILVQLQKKLSYKSSRRKRYDTFNLLKKSLNHTTGSGLEPVHVSWPKVNICIIVCVNGPSPTDKKESFLKSLYFFSKMAKFKFFTKWVKFNAAYCRLCFMPMTVRFFC